MKYTKNQWVAALTNLLKMTSRGEISWEETADFDNEDGHSVDRAFQATTSKARYVLRKEKRRTYTDVDEYYLSTFFVLDIYKKNPIVYTKVATSPDIAVSASLFRAVEETRAFSTGALDELLGPGDM